MGAFEDMYNTFKKMPLWGRILVVVITLGVIGYAIYKGYQAQQAAAAASSSGSTSTTLNPSSASPMNPADLFGGTSATTPAVSTAPGVNGNVPVWQSLMQPIFDGMGNLIGWEPPTSTGTTTAPPTTPGTPQPGPIVAPPTGTGTPIATPILSKQPYYSNAQISQQGSNFFLVQGANKINLASIFPKGTIFTGGGHGQAYYTEPGQARQTLVAHGFGVNG